MIEYIEITKVDENKIIQDKYIEFEERLMDFIGKSISYATRDELENLRNEIIAFNLDFNTNIYFPQIDYLILKIDEHNNVNVNKCNYLRCKYCNCYGGKSIEEK